MKTYKTILITILILVPITILSYCGFFFFALSGQVNHVYRFNSNNAFISRLFPTNRLDEITRDISNSFQTMIYEPVYFRVKTPVHFDKTTIQVTFSPGEQKTLELGLAHDAEATSVEMQPLYNKYVEDLLINPDWHNISANGYILLQKNQKYQNIPNFESNIANIPKNEIAFYNISQAYPYNIANYVAANTTKSYDICLQGKHEIVTYINNEKLNFIIKLSDNSKGNFVVYNYQNEEVYKKNISSSIVPIEIPELLPGIYKIILNIDNESKILNIKTNQKLWSFNYFMNFCENNTPPVLYSDSNKVFLQAKDEGGVQIAHINNAKFNIAERNKQYIIPTEQKLNSISLSAGGLIVNVNSTLSLVPDNYLNPYYLRLSDIIDLPQANDLQYIFLNYNPPKKTGDQYIANVDFNLENVYIDANKLVKFVISAPNIEKINEKPKFYELRATLTRQPMTIQTIFQKIVSKMNYAQ